MGTKFPLLNTSKKNQRTLSFKVCDIEPPVLDCNARVILVETQQFYAFPPRLQLLFPRAQEVRKGVQGNAYVGADTGILDG